MTHDIAKLERDLKTLEMELVKLGSCGCETCNNCKLGAVQGASSDYWRELFKIIHFPGWTTPAEFLLVSSLVENMIAQTRTLAQQQQTLLAGARAVTEKAA